jgi:choline-sulfatase
MPPDAPNLLLVCTDQQRPDWFGWTDVPVETPNAARLADRGVRFENAVCPTPVCNPCRAALAAGMEYDRTGVPNNEVDYPVERGTLYRRLRDEAGYHVAGTGKFDLTASYGLGDDGVPPDEWGFSDATFTPAKNETVGRARAAGVEPGDPYTAFLADRDLLETHVEDYRRRSRRHSSVPTDLPDEAYYDNWITRQGRRLIGDAPDDRPWFVQVNLQNPHNPWDVTESMHDRFRDPDVDFPPPAGGPGDVAPGDHQEVRRNYGAMVEHLDDCLGRLIDAVEARGDVEDTIVIFTSDHGEALGDHGQWWKDSPLRPSVGVPLVVGGPGVEPRPPVEEPATILDLHATALDYAGLDTGSVDSRSMRPLLAGEASPPREVVYSGLSAWRMVFDGRFKLVCGYDPDRRTGWEYEPRGIEPNEVTRLLGGRGPVLYDLEGPGEPVDVADDHPAVVERLTDRLESIRGRPETFGPAFDIVPPGGDE